MSDKSGIYLKDVPGFVLDVARAQGWLDPREAAALRAERDALADRLAIAERAAREEREARIAAERHVALADDVLDRLEAVKAAWLARVEVGDLGPAPFCGWCGEPMEDIGAFKAHAVRCGKNPAVQRAERYRLRLARVLRVEAVEMERLWKDTFFEWMTHRGGVWSARALSGGKGEER